MKEFIDKKSNYIVAALILLSVFLAAETLLAFKDLRSPNAVQNSLAVQGEGEIVAVPDVATFSFSVSADAQAVDDAQSQVTQGMDKVLKALKDLGVEDKDIKTVNYSIYPKYTYQQAPCTPVSCPPGRQTQDGYTATHSVSVKLEDTKLAGQALAAVSENGATDVSGISFTTENPDEILMQAREMAIKDAKAKAKELVKSLGVRLGDVTSFSDNSANQPIPYSLSAGTFKDSSASVPTIPEGENKVKVNVTVVYEIR